MSGLVWNDIESAPQGQLVMTKIDDGGEVRNEQMLRREKNMFFRWRNVRLLSTHTLAAFNAN